MKVKADRDEVRRARTYVYPYYLASTQYFYIRDTTTPCWIRAGVPYAYIMQERSRRSHIKPLPPSRPAHRPAHRPAPPPHLSTPKPLQYIARNATVAVAGL